MRNIQIASVVVFGCLAIMHGTSRAQFDQYGRWDYHEGYEPAHFAYYSYTSDQASDLISLWTRLGETSHEVGWHGDYLRSYGDLGTSFLRLMAGTGYVRLTTHSCRPDVRRFDYGSVQEFEDRVLLEPANSLGTATTLIKVTWGRRRYLVEEARMEEFGQFASGRRVRAQGEWPGDSFFLHELDQASEVGGIPILPKRYSRYSEQPIRAKLTQVKCTRLSKSTTQVEARFNRGTKSGIRKGMTLYTRSGDNFMSLWVSRVGSTWCQAISVSNAAEDLLGHANESLFNVGREWTTCSQCVLTLQEYEILIR